MSTACLLIHGFTGTPFEMEPLAPALAALGCSVDIPLLPGHGTSIADFRSTYFPDWLAGAETRLLDLSRTHDRVFVVGFSMGGTLALLLAAKHPAAVAGAVAISAPLFTSPLPPWKARDWRLLFAPILKYFTPVIPIKPPRPESRAIAPCKGYEGVLCLPQLHSLTNGFKETRAALPYVACPLLIMHDLHDRIAPPSSALTAAQNVSSQDLTLRYTRILESVTSKHMLTTHQETSSMVAAEVAEFVARRM